jgi:hypothetical protein
LEHESSFIAGDFVVVARGRLRGWRRERLSTGTRSLRVADAINERSNVRLAETYRMTDAHRRQFAGRDHRPDGANRNAKFVCNFGNAQKWLAFCAHASIYATSEFWVNAGEHLARKKTIQLCENSRDVGG